MRDKHLLIISYGIHTAFEKLANKMIDLADIFIGATALTHSIPIATLNDKHFNWIKGLEIIK